MGVEGFAADGTEGGVVKDGAGVCCGVHGAVGAEGGGRDGG